MAVQNGKTETATFATPQTSLQIYWGSIDALNVDGILNEIAITIDGYTLTGTDLVAMGMGVPEPAISSHRRITSW